MLSFKPAFSLSSFTFIKNLFSSSSLSPIRVVSSAYLRLLMFLLAILIPACASYSTAFYIMYSTYKLNNQGGNIKPWCTPFPKWALLHTLLWGRGSRRMTQKKRSRTESLSRCSAQWAQLEWEAGNTRSELHVAWRARLHRGRCVSFSFHLESWVFPELKHPSRYCCRKGTDRPGVPGLNIVDKMLLLMLS